MRHHSGGDAAEQVPREPAAAVGAEHDEARLALVGDLDDSLPRWRCRDRDALRSEPRLLCQGCSVRGDPLGGLPYLGGLGGVEGLLADGQKSDIARLPNAENQRVASGCELTAGLVDREL